MCVCVCVGGWGREFTHSKTTFSPSTIQTRSQHHVYCYKLSPSTKFIVMNSSRVIDTNTSRFIVTNTSRFIVTNSAQTPYKLRPSTKFTVTNSLSPSTKFTVTNSAQAPSLQLQSQPKHQVYSYKLQAPSLQLQSQPKHQVYSYKLSPSAKFTVTNSVTTRNIQKLKGDPR